MMSAAAISRFPVAPHGNQDAPDSCDLIGSLTPENYRKITVSNMRTKSLKSRNSKQTVLLLTYIHQLKK
jgi:hypothetical protein